MITFVFLMVCIALADQDCGDPNAICVGSGESYTDLTSAVAAVTLGSGIEYILLKEDLYSSLEPSYPVEIGSSNSAGTPEQYITIMPHPEVVSPIRVELDTLCCEHEWLIFKQPYWRLSGGVNQMLIFVIGSAETQEYGIGMVMIDGDSGGKITIDNMMFLNERAYISQAISIWCHSGHTGGCDDDAFEGIVIDNVEFYDYNEIGMGGVKVSIQAYSWTTTKVEIKNCHFHAHESTFSSRNIVFNNMYHGLDDKGYGCRNCLIHDNVFGEARTTIQASVGADIHFYDNVITHGFGLDLGVVFLSPEFDYNQDDQALSGFYFYDNIIEMGDTREQNSYFLVIDDYLDRGLTFDWLEDIVFRNNVINNLKNCLISIEDFVYDGNLGMDITFDGNRITTMDYQDFGEPLIQLISGNPTRPEDEFTKTFTFINNHVTWDVSHHTENTVWVYSQDAHFDVLFAYNYLELIQDTTSVPVLEGKNDGNGAFRDIVFYGNVIFYEIGGQEFSSDYDAVDFMNTCDNLTVEYNLFSNSFIFTPGSNEQNNDISEFGSAYFEADPCVTNYYVPYNELYTPETDINGNVRVLANNSWIGPETCYVHINDDTDDDIDDDDTDDDENDDDENDDIEDDSDDYTDDDDDESNGGTDIEGIIGFSVGGSVIVVLTSFSLLIMILICCFCCCCCITVSFVFVLVVFVFCACLLFRRRSLTDRQKYLLEESEVSVSDINIATLNINKDLFRIKLKEIKLEKILGEGGSASTVYLADFQGTKVAFKGFKTSTLCNSQDNFDEFEKELSILGSLSHPNTLRFYGAILEPPRVGLIMEYCPHGDLRVFLMNHKVEHEESYPLEKKIERLHEIAKAMKFLHSRNIIHRDLKCENVLISDDLSCKVMDFGCSKLVERMTIEKTKRIGTPQYMAPEIVLGTNRNYSSKVDVFSYSIVMFTVFSEKFFNPYGDDMIQQCVELKVANDPGFRPNPNDMNKGLNKGEEVPKWIVDLVKRCWSHDPENRNDFEMICEIFSENE